MYICKIHNYHNIIIPEISCIINFNSQSVMSWSSGTARIEYDVN